MARGLRVHRAGRGTVCVRARLFFFQAEDGIRDYKVTGVQTCALPISLEAAGRSRVGRNCVVSLASLFLCRSAALRHWALRPQLKREPLGGIKQPSRMFLSKRAAALAQYEGHDHGCYSVKLPPIRARVR